MTVTAASLALKLNLAEGMLFSNVGTHRRLRAGDGVASGRPMQGDIMFLSILVCLYRACGLEVY